MNKKLWIRLFINVAVIFAVFVIILAIANSALLTGYFTAKEERLLIENSAALASVDINDTNEVTDKINEISDKYNFDIEIYEKNGNILYTTIGTQMMDYIHSGFDRPGFSMNHEEMETVKQSVTDDGAVIETAVSRFNRKEYLLCKRETNGVITELRIQTDILENSAEVASEFIIIIAFICLLLSLVWVFIFAKKFAAPITEMSDITEKMSELDFTRKVNVRSSDEIGQLGSSINNLSDKLDSALCELRSANERLTDEIELERRLDVMRKAFVANVSHELKTPLSVISGYAEGLKLNVNSASKDNYCDTIIDETERMNRLVLSILELSKYESGQIPLSNDVFDISAVAQDMAKRILSARPDIRLTNLIPERTLLYSDPVQTEQILKSYLENAAAHTPENGNITLSCEEAGDRLKIKIFNSGELIEPDIMPHIWESFWRADKAHSRAEGRFGLGLSIVSAIVKNQGCSCGVYNTDSGVCFWFTATKAQKEQNDLH